MPDDEKPEETDETTETTETTEVEETGEAGSEGGTPPAPVEKPKLSYDDLEKELTRTRGEAANYRVKLREAQASLEAAKTPEDIEAAVAEFREQNARLERQLLVNEVARDLPDDLREVIATLAESGLPEDALKAKAAQLSKYATPAVEPGHLEGGLRPDEEPDDDPSDPRELANKYGRRGRSRRDA